MNNKGFAITTILYGTLILFCLLLVSLLGILSVFRSNLQLLIENDHGARSIATIKKQNVSSYDSVEKQGLYCINSTNCKYISNSELAFNDESNAKSFAYTGGPQEYTAKESGYYKIELWGAQGGNGSGATGGKGAYTSGYIYLNENEKIFVYVGGKGNSTSAGAASSVAGGFNGGGATGGQACCNRIYGSGGGATDIRLVYGMWNETNSLNSRIMVAAGGGGAFTGNNAGVIANNGGAGGALFGANGTQGGSSETTTYCYGEGATQTAGGKITTNCTKASDYGNAITGSFGLAGGANSTVTGGGGGYYGGSRSGHIASGGGGSSFISGFAGVNAIASDRAHTNDTLHFSGKYFLGGSITAGTNTGNGKALITYVGIKIDKTSNKLDNVRYIRDCTNGNNINTNNHWVEFQAIKDGRNIAKGKTATGITNVSSYPITNITNGDITSANYAEGGKNGNTCVTIDLGTTVNLDEVAVWHYFADGRKYNSNVTSVSSNNSNWITVISNNNVETDYGKRVSAWN